MMSHNKMSQFSCLTTVCRSDASLLIEYLLSFLIGITLFFPKAIYRILEGGASSILRVRKPVFSLRNLKSKDRILLILIRIIT